MSKPIWGPRCPNHKVHLIDAKDGKGICPTSGCVFSYDANEAEKTKKLKINSLGQQYLDGDWKPKVIEGEDV